MADYKPVAANTPDLARSVVASLEWAVEHERPLIAKFAQSLLDEFVDHGYVVPRHWWGVRDTKTGDFAARDLPSKAAALAKRRELGGSSARFRVEPLFTAAPWARP